MRTVMMLVLVAVLAGCGSVEQPGPAADHNQADVFFAQRMVMHHTQAVDVAKLVEGRTGNEHILDLGKRIQESRQPEMRQLSGWVTQWGATPNTRSESIPGRMSAADVTQLGKLTDEKFDSQWLQLMIVHHRGVEQMVTTELSQGGNAEAKALAQQLVDAQQPELDQMQGMTGG